MISRLLTFVKGKRKKAPWFVDNRMLLCYNVFEDYKMRFSLAKGAGT